MRLSDRWRFWLTVCLAWFVWGTLYALNIRADKPRQSVWEILHYAYSDAIIWACLTPLIFWLAKRVAIRSPHGLSRCLIHLALGVAIAFVEIVCDAVQHNVLDFGSGQPTPIPAFIAYAFPYRMDSNLLIYAVLVGIGHALQHHKRMQETRQKADALRVDLAEARMMALRLQLQPHFLFNCLNTISGLVIQRPQEAQKMICRLSELLRMALKTHQQEEIPLGDELRFVRAYLDIEKMRFGEKLRVSIDVSEECLDLLVPAFLVQPLVENAVRHGVSPKPGGGHVHVRARRLGPDLELVVEDDGVGIQGPTKTGIGLASVRRRLERLYGQKHRWELSRVKEGTSVRIVFPAQPTLVGASV